MLSANTILEYVQTRDMITGYGDLEKQIQTNGFDFRVGSIQEFLTRPLEINEDNRTKPLLVDTSRNFVGSALGEGNSEDYVLEPNKAYVVKLAERISLPTNVAALARPRSSFIRVGASIHTGVWDAGYEGHSTILLKNGPNYLHVREGTRIVQMVFFELDKDSFAYDGIYQGE